MELVVQPVAPTAFRFAVLDHDHPFPHRDLLLERDGVLKAWRLPPHFDGTAAATAEPLSDHRLIYLDYEGNVDDARGRVSRWDGGALEWVEVGDAGCVVELSGRKLRGRLVLSCEVDGGWRIAPSGLR